MHEFTGKKVIATQNLNAHDCKEQIILLHAHVMMRV
jgi:hypothetical protein